MANRLTAFSARACASALILGMATHAAANMYRYTDESGQVVISSTIPQEATKRGYDILGNNGRVIETIPPAPTEEEIAARARGPPRPRSFQNSQSVHR